MPKQRGSKEKKWYVIHTYAGYEDNVAENLKQRIESMEMHDKIFQILVPREKKIKIRNGKRHIIEERIFPGYVLVEMIVTDDSWYVVRNTPNVTGFVGSGTFPIPISPEEMKRIKKRMGQAEPKYKIDIVLGEPVRVTDGPFKNFEGKINEIDETRGKVKVLVNMFGRETPVELDYLQVKKL